jgi:hypothetical protein
MTTTLPVAPRLPHHLNKYTKEKSKRKEGHMANYEKAIVSKKTSDISL